MNTTSNTAAKGYGSKLDNAKKTSEDKVREQRQVARARHTEENRQAEAYAKGETMDLDKALDGFIAASDKEALASKSAIAAITVFLAYDGWADMRASTSTGNLGPIWEKREALRKAIARKAFLAGKANKDMHWSRLCKAQREHLGGKGDRKEKPIATVAKAALTSLYKRFVKIESPTEKEFEVCDMLGRMLVTYYKVDLASLK